MEFSFKKDFYLSLVKNRGEGMQKIFGIIYSVVVLALFSGIVLYAQTQEGGMYGNTVIGALYEILWIPVLGSMFVMPFVWIYAIWKKNVSKLLGGSFVLVFILLLSIFFCTI